jgi:hypothetical protein
MMVSSPIPIRYLSARAAASSAAHVEEPFLRPLGERPDPKSRSTALPVPDPAGVVRKIGRSVLRCPGQADIQRTVLHAMPDFLWAKLQLMEGVSMSGCIVRLSSLVALSVLLLAVSGLCPSIAEAQGWSSDPSLNTPVSTAIDNQQSPVAVSDGAGALIVAWIDLRNLAISAKWR